MAANNETGVIQPYENIGELCHKYHAPFLCDTTQYIGKAPFNFSESNIDYAVLSGHKIGATEPIFSKIEQSVIDEEQSKLGN